jgi:pimeloyl-ACP methyl ester carboxylesterase
MSRGGLYQPSRPPVHSAPNLRGTDPALEKMPTDEVLLERHRRFLDQRAGIQEQFLQPKLGPGHTVGVLSRPIGPQLPIGWVICHSYGIEQVNTHRLEVVAARAMARAGFPVLRFHVQGYGDSQLRGQAVDVSWHLEGGADAVELVRRLEGVTAVGVLGVRFGAMVAAMLAERTELPIMALWQPFTSGAQFLEEFLQTAFFEQMFDQLSQESRSAAGLAEHLDAQGWKDLNGFRFTRQAYEAISAMDLTRDVTGFRGSALVIGLSRSGAMPRQAAELAAHLRGLGAACDERTIRDNSAPMLGQHHFMKIGDGEVERDIFFQAFQAIAESTVRWALGQVRATAGDDVGQR